MNRLVVILFVDSLLQILIPNITGHLKHLIVLVVAIAISFKCLHQDSSTWGSKVIRHCRLGLIPRDTSVSKLQKYLLKELSGKLRKLNLRVITIHGYL